MDLSHNDFCLLCITLGESRIPQMRFVQAPQKSYPLRTLSPSGLSLRLPPHGNFKPQTGLNYQAELEVEGQWFGLEWQVERVENGEWFGRFVLLGSDLQDKIAETCKFARLGWELSTAPLIYFPHQASSLDAMGLQKDETGLSIWYRPSTCMIGALQLEFERGWIYREQFKPTRTGKINPGAALMKGQQRKAEFKEDRALNYDLIQKAAQLLGSLPASLAGIRLWQFLEMGEQVALPQELIDKISKAA